MKICVGVLTALTLLVAVSSPARADVGFESSSRKAGAPGERVELTVGCGFCFPPCVGAVGHRHPPGDPNGTCMLGDRGGPPASFPVWLTPRRHSLDRYLCDPGEYADRGRGRRTFRPSSTWAGRRRRAAPTGLPLGLATTFRVTGSHSESRRFDPAATSTCSSATPAPTVRGEPSSTTVPVPLGPCGCCRRLRRQAARVGAGRCLGSAPEPSLRSSLS
jgi:hypothetical protein